MESEYNLSEKTQILTDAYQKMNDEGRDFLEKTILKLKQINSESQMVKEIVLNGVNTNT